MRDAGCGVVSQGVRCGERDKGDKESEERRGCEKGREDWEDSMRD